MGEYRQDHHRQMAPDRSEWRALVNALRGTTRVSGTRCSGLPQMGDGLRVVANGTRCGRPIAAAGLLSHGAGTARQTGKRKATSSSAGNNNTKKSAMTKS